MKKDLIITGKCTRCKKEKELGAPEDVRKSPRLIFRCECGGFMQESSVDIKRKIVK